MENFKTIYLYTGIPYLVEMDEYGEYDYPEEEWTEIAPPNGIYQPFYFDGSEWIGTSEEQYLKDNPVEPKLPSENDLLRKTLLTLNAQLAAMRKEVAKIPELKAELEELKEIKEETTKQLEEVETL